MSERGVFAVDRGLFQHPRFADEPFTEREAWIWLIGQAAFKPHRRRVGSVMVNLVRGQIAASLRFMADTWKWSEASVRRYIAKLKADDADDGAMIDAASDAGVTVITIYNYNKYQYLLSKRDADDGAEDDAPKDADVTQERRNKERTLSFFPSLVDSSLDSQQSSELRARDALIELEAEFTVWYGRYPNKVGRAAARKSFVTARKSANQQELLDGIARYIREKPPDRPWCNPATWLNQQRWLDAPASVSEKGQPASFFRLAQQLQGNRHEPEPANQSYDLDLKPAGPGSHDSEFGCDLPQRTGTHCG